MRAFLHSRRGGANPLVVLIGAAATILAVSSWDSNSSRTLSGGPRVLHAGHSPGACRATILTPGRCGGRSRRGGGAVFVRAGR